MTLNGKGKRRRRIKQSYDIFIHNSCRPMSAIKFQATNEANIQYGPNENQKIGTSCNGKQAN